LTITPIPSSHSSSPSAALLSFSATVFPDGSLFTVARQTREAAERAAGSDAKTYDGLFVRHWDEWSSTEGEKKQVFVVRLERNPTEVTTGAKKEEESGTDSDASLEDFEVVEKPVDGEKNRDEKKAESVWRMQLEQHEDEAGVLSQQPRVLSPLAGTMLVRLIRSRLLIFFSPFLSLAGMPRRSFRRFLRLLPFLHPPPLPLQRPSSQPRLAHPYSSLPRPPLPSLSRRHEAPSTYDWESGCVFQSGVESGWEEGGVVRDARGWVRGGPEQGRHL
jgi:hypothetical protein